MVKPGSFLWNALEIYGTRVHHPGKWRVHEWLRNKLRVSYGGDLQVERQGLRWLLNPSDFVQSTFFWTGEFETWDWYHFLALLKPEAIVFDIGANFGYYSALTALLLNDKGHVYAFEPCRKTYDRLHTNILLNRLQSSVTAVPIALSDHCGSAYLDQTEGNSGATHISKQGDAITLDTVDHFCETHPIPRIDVIKIDVEGHELHVLTGAKQAIERWRPNIMIEFNPEALQRFGASAAQLENLLRSWGYQLSVPDRKKLIPFDRVPAGWQILNVFAVPGRG
jgi:FkbM family methyltransferase